LASSFWCSCTAPSWCEVDPAASGHGSGDASNVARQFSSP
jgi:hypothetical protein